MAEALEGKDFVALVRLSTKDDGTLAVAGETCDRVPACALQWLLDSRLIRRCEPAAAPVSQDPTTDLADLREGE